MMGDIHTHMTIPLKGIEDDERALATLYGSISAWCDVFVRERGCMMPCESLVLNTPSHQVFIAFSSHDDKTYQSPAVMRQWVDNLSKRCAELEVRAERAEACVRRLRDAAVQEVEQL